MSPKQSRVHPGAHKDTKPSRLTGQKKGRTGPHCQSRPSLPTRENPVKSFQTSDQTLISSKPSLRHENQTSHSNKKQASVKTTAVRDLRVQPDLTPCVPVKSQGHETPLGPAASSNPHLHVFQSLSPRLLPEDAIVPLRRKIARRLYEPLILLRVLDPTRGNHIRCFRSEVDSSKDELRRSFIDSIAVVCNFKRWRHGDGCGTPEPTARRDRLACCEQECQALYKEASSRHSEPPRRYQSCRQDRYL